MPDAPQPPPSTLRSPLTAEEQRILLEEQVVRLTEEKVAALDALESAVLMGVFRPDADRQAGVAHILEQTLEKLGRLLPFTAMAIYLVNEEDSSFELERCIPDDRRDDMERETETLIDENAFAWALSHRKPRLLTSRHVPGRLFIHPIATASRIRGMFIGLLDPSLSGLQDINHSLASILLLSSAAAIESFEVYAYVKGLNETLEANVAELAASERRLEQEVAERTKDLSLEVQERRKAQKDLLRERDFIQTIYDTAGALIAVLDPQGRFQHCNRAMELTTGLSCEEMTGRPFGEFLANTAIAVDLQETFATLTTRGDVLREELRLRSTSGAVRDVSWSFTAMGESQGDAVEHLVATGMDMTDKRSAEEALRDSETRFRAVFTEAGTGIALFDAGGFCLDANPRLATMLQLHPQELPGALLQTHAHPGDAMQLAQGIRDLFSGMTSRRLDIRFVDRHGRWLWTQCALSLVRGRGGKAHYGIAMIEDVTKRHEMEDALRAAEATYRTIFENAVEGIFQADLGGGFRRINPAMAAMFGYDSPEEMAKDVSDAVALLCNSPESRKAFLEKLTTDQTLTSFEMQARHRDGHSIWISISARTLFDASQGVHYVEGLAEDITDRKASELLLQQKATLDELTGIPNRYQFQERFEQLLAQSRRRMQPLAVLYIDLDGFKQVNDNHGHHIGDQVLREAAQRLHDRVRRSDIAARLGGDEFGVLLVGTAKETEIVNVGKSIVDALTLPYLVAQEEGSITCHIGASIGASLSPIHGGDSDTLLRKADAAMYASKQQGGNRISIYSDALAPRPKA